MLAQVQQLYQIEARQREARASPEAVLVERRRSSAPIIERIKAKLDHHQSSRKHLPRSLTGEALTYALNQWDKLAVFLNDGLVQIDNNLVENAIRPNAIGKKNYPSRLGLRSLASHGYCRSAAGRWLFIGDTSTGDRAATFYTLIGNAHRVGINVEAYLTNIFTRLPDRNESNRAPPGAPGVGRRANCHAQHPATKRRGRSIERTSIKRTAKWASFDGYYQSTSDCIRRRTTNPRRSLRDVAFRATKSPIVNETNKQSREHTQDSHGNWLKVRGHSTSPFTGEQQNLSSLPLAGWAAVKRQIRDPQKSIQLSKTQTDG